LTIKYLRRESFSIYPTLLSKTVITADQKVPRIPGHCFIRAADSKSPNDAPHLDKLVELSGIEPPAPRLRSGRFAALP